MRNSNIGNKNNVVMMELIANSRIGEMEIHCCPAR